MTDGRSFAVGMRLDERATEAAVAKLRALVEAGDPAIIEDLKSLNESAPFAILMAESRRFHDVRTVRDSRHCGSRGAECRPARVAKLDPRNLGVRDGTQAHGQAVRGDATGRKNSPGSLHLIRAA